MCNCQNKKYLDDGIEGLNEADYMLIGGAVGGYVAAAYVDNMLVYDENGVRKTTGLAPVDKDMMRNGLFVVGGLGLAWMWGNEPAAKGAGVGATVYGVKQLIRGQYPDAGIAGRTTTGQQKYIAGEQQNGRQKYIAAAMKNPTIDLTKNTNKENATEKIIIKNRRA